LSRGTRGSFMEKGPVGRGREGERPSLSLGGVEKKARNAGGKEKL